MELFDIEKNYAFVDGQNLIYSTKRNSERPWIVDLRRFRVYLKEKYDVFKAFYFVGAYNENHVKLYDALKDDGFIVVFREHDERAKSSKKGNVDTDIVFSVMRGIAEKERFNKIILVSGDGDYYKMVEYLIEKKRFRKLLSPSKRNTSSLYTVRIGDIYIDYLDKNEIRKKIILQ